MDPKGATFKALLRKVAGGPVPPGEYLMEYISSHDIFRECIHLKPLKIEELIPGITEYKKRSGFFIHGRGDRGSDGCIVPYIPAQRKELNKAVKTCGTEVKLIVRDPGMPYYLFQQIIRKAQTC